MSSELRQGSGVTAIIIDDDVGVRRVFARLLQRAGFSDVHVFPRSTVPQHCAGLSPALIVASDITPAAAVELNRACPAAAIVLVDGTCRLPGAHHLPKLEAVRWLPTFAAELVAEARDAPP